MTRALFDTGRFGSRSFNDAFRDIFGVTPRTVGEAESDDDAPDTDALPIPVSQQDGE